MAAGTSTKPRTGALPLLGGQSTGAAVDLAAADTVEAGDSVSLPPINTVQALPPGRGRVQQDLALVHVVPESDNGPKTQTGPEHWILSS